MKALLIRLGFLSLILALWAITSKANLWNSYLFPGPGEVWGALKDGFKDHSLVIASIVSLKRVLIGFGFSLIVGTLIGLLTGTNEFFDYTIGTIALGLQTLPSICWLPMAILWFGLNEKAILFVVVMGALLAVTIAVHDGVKNLPPIYVKAARTLGAGKFKLVFGVILPAALPSIISGAKQGWAFAWRSLMSGELLFVSAGLGHSLMMGRDLNDMSQVLAVMAVIILIGIIADRLLFAPLERAVRQRWGFERA